MQNAKSKMFRNKKAINDISIIAILLFIFFGTAIIIPYINDEFGTTADTYDTDQLHSDIQDEGEEIEGKITDISAVKVFVNVLKLAFFDFGNTLELPFWLDAIYTVLAIIFILVIARNIWFGGGG